MLQDKWQKLGLRWIGKGDGPVLEPGIYLIENPESRFGDPNSVNVSILNE